MRNVIVLLLSLFALHANAQQATPAPAIKGKFHVYIDDSIRLYLNGAQLLALDNTWRATQTAEVDLKPGDRIVARIANAGGPRGFMLFFVSSDLRQAAKFTNVAFRMLLDPSKVDFTPSEFASCRVAKQDRRKDRQPFPFKCNSEWVWGDSDACTLAAIVTNEMFQPLQR